MDTQTTKPAILAIATGVPPYGITQEAYTDFTIKATQLPEKFQPKLRSLCAAMAIERRYFCVDEALKERSEWKVLPKDFPNTNMSMTTRNEVYKREAPKLAVQVAKEAMAEWGGDPHAISHVVAVSCTGVMAPGIEYSVIKELGLRYDVERVGINLMGCFGVFRALATARALANECPSHRVLIVAVELCSMHFQAEPSLETFIGNALFGDGAGALVVGGGRFASHERPLWELARFASHIVPDTPDMMTWSASDHGFLMKLSATIPASLKADTPTFARKLLGDNASFVESTWAIHPGGKAIVAGIQESCGLEDAQTTHSWEVLRQYGNMSSATIVFVLDELRKRGELRGEYTVAMGFGPGLSLEGVLLKNLPQLFEYNAQHKRDKGISTQSETCLAVTDEEQMQALPVESAPAAASQ